jgi:hypothetical protein
MRYPIPLCGDHVEFEASHADISPQERADWPLPSFDARDWAAAFVKTFPNTVPEDVMLTWFANALMRGYDERDGRPAS